MRQLLYTRIFTDYGQFDLAWGDEGGFDGDFDVRFAGQVNGLVGAAHPGGVYINLARRSGGSSVCIRLHDDEPPVSGWYEDVVEVSTVIPEGADIGWLSWAGESSGALPSIPGGPYRIRVSAKGRDEADEIAEGVVDEYMIEIWPAPVSDDAILRSTTKNAAYWHKEVGSRR
jgi:hypothetical protein